VGLIRKLPKFPINNDNDLKLFWKIASLETKSRKMWSNRYLKIFSWADWYALEDDIAELYGQTSQLQAIVEKIESRLELN
tara:strand:+ start:157 stop:396 length:240 start_codon:yes stop_codon:yes gene_type:complete